MTDNAPRGSKTLPPGMRPASLAEPPGPHERIQQHTVEQFGDLAPFVQILDTLVPQTVVRQPRAVCKYWARVTWSTLSCDHAARVPAVQVREGEGAAVSVPRQSGGNSSCFTETGAHSAKLRSRP